MALQCTRMDARNLKSRFFRAEPFILVVLVVVLALGLWQGYGAWLLGGGVDHAG